METKSLAAKIVNPSQVALTNCKKSGIATAQVHGPKFKKLSADKGVGRFLIAIMNHPGLSKTKLFATIFGPDYHGAAYAETFTGMKASGVIENRKPGYFITPLGISVLKQHNLI